MEMLSQVTSEVPYSTYGGIRVCVDLEILRMCPWLPVRSTGLAKEGASICSMIAFLALFLFGAQVNKVL